MTCCESAVHGDKKGLEDGCGWRRGDEEWQVVKVSELNEVRQKTGYEDELKVGGGVWGGGEMSRERMEYV